MRHATQAVVFDLDDTLYAERDYVRGGYRAAASHLREALGRDEAFEDWLWQRFQAGQASGAFDALNEHFGLGLDAGAIAALVGVYRNHQPDIRPRPGAVEVLRRLRRRCRLGLLSDGYLPAQRLKLDALRIAPMLDAVVMTEEMGRQCWKPAPDGFVAIRAMLATAHEACAYVADNPAKDFIAPNRLGWRSVQLLCPGQIHSANAAPQSGQPQCVIASLDELESVLFLEEGPGS
jgi:putative hydrolase of the HAD superfamily